MSSPGGGILFLVHHPVLQDPSSVNKVTPYSPHWECSVLLSAQIEVVGGQVESSVLSSAALYA